MTRVLLRGGDVVHTFDCARVLHELLLRDAPGLVGLVDGRTGAARFVAISDVLGVETA